MICQRRHDEAPRTQQQPCDAHGRGPRGACDTCAGVWGCAQTHPIPWVHRRVCSAAEFVLAQGGVLIEVRELGPQQDVPHGEHLLDEHEGRNDEEQQRQLQLRHRVPRFVQHVEENDCNSAQPEVLDRRVGGLLAGQWALIDGVGCAPQKRKTVTSDRVPLSQARRERVRSDLNESMAAPSIIVCWRSCGGSRWAKMAHREEEREGVLRSQHARSGWTVGTHGAWSSKLEGGHANDPRISTNRPAHRGDEGDEQHAVNERPEQPPWPRANVVAGRSRAVGLADPRAQPVWVDQPAAAAEG